jgi:predicted heme/steroid binding protein/uncharacterized membrane protein
LTTPKKVFTLEEIKASTGAAGQPAYVVYQGRVIDVSASPLWPAGHHMGRHQAGRDLTGEITAAPHGPEILERYPEVGFLRTAAPGDTRVPASLARLFHYVPLLRRHPHPMVVHFPIAFLMAQAGFAALFLLTGNPSFETTAWYCLWGGVLFSLPAIATGLFTWWLNYEARFLRPVIMKLTLSPLVVLLGTATLIWRYVDPTILVVLRPASCLYFGSQVALAALAGAIGWYGGTLSFPLEGD